MCVDGETKIFTNPQGQIKVKDVFDEKGIIHTNGKNVTVELNRPLSTYAFKDGKISRAKITHITKLSAPTYKIKISDGNEIKASQNQPFLVYDAGDLVWKGVTDLKKGDYIARLNEIETKEKSYKIRPEKIENIMKIGKGYTLKNRNLTRSNIINLPATTSEELMEFLGLLISDGSICKRGESVAFSNNNEHLRKKFKHLLKRVFNITKSKEYNDGRVVVYSKTLIAFLNHLEFRYDNKLHIPGYFYKLPRNEIKAFIRGYFDGDGTVAMTNHYPTPKLFSVSKDFIQELQALLQIKLGISSKIGEHNTPKGRVYELVVRGYEGRKKFLEIGSSSKDKRMKLEKIKDVRRIKDFQDLPSPSLLINEIKNKLPYKIYRNKDYYVYGAGNITKHALSTLYKLAENNNIMDTILKKEYQTLMRNDIGWERIESINFLGEQELYDFTVDKDSFVGGPYFLLHNSKFYGQSEENLRKVFEEAEKNAPSIIFLDEIDAIAPKRSEVHGEVERRVVSQLLTLMDGLKGRGKLIVIGATNIPESIDPALRRPGRFDREIRIDVPDRNGRKEILQIHTRGMPMSEDCNLDELADITYGFVGADLAALAREAAMNALRRYLPEIDLEKPIPVDMLEKMTVTMEDFKNAHRGIDPSAMREFFVEIPKVSWDDIGGLDEVKQALKEAVEWPLTQPEVFKRMGITAPRGILLYGPPGTGKTLLAKAVASESKANFISIKGPEVLSKWVGESEKAVRELFKKARQVAPTIVFLDEIDSIAPRRGMFEGSHVTESVVNQLLTSIDGLESMEGVVIIGATNRPDIIDPGLLRPGRFDRLIFIPAPDKKERLEIFKIHTKNMPLAKDVSLEELAEKCNNYSGADIEGLCREAAMLALRSDIKAKEVKKTHFEQAMKTIHGGITEDILKYYSRVKEDIGSGLAKKDKRDKDIQYI
ncbi:MAG: AAA family ATPase [Thermoplasmatota archaeon]